MPASRIAPLGNFANMPAHRHIAVSPDDDNDLVDQEGQGILARALFIGGAGDISIHDHEGNAVTYTIATGAVPFILPVVTRRVLQTNTNATNIVALW